ncbi:MAG: hypothetical protein WCG08_08580 [Paludibacter sp.]
MRSKLLTVLSISLVCGFVACTVSGPTNVTTWNCAESSIKGSRTYLVDFYRESKDTTLYLISNFHNTGFEGTDVEVKISSGKLTFNRPLPQNIPTTSYIIKSGSGVVNKESNVISIDYVIYDGLNDIAFHVDYKR